MAFSERWYEALKECREKKLVISKTQNARSSRVLDAGKRVGRRKQKKKRNNVNVNERECDVKTTTRDKTRISILPFAVKNVSPFLRQAFWFINAIYTNADAIADKGGQRNTD